jgi:hypothetical protein
MVFSLKYAFGCLCICLYIADIQYHMMFFTRYFVLQFAFAAYSWPVASLIVLIGYYMLMRNMILFTLAARMSPGRVSEVKESRINHEKRR